MYNSKNWENKGISNLRHILNEQCEPLMHNELNHKYHINTFLQTTEIHKFILKQWLCKLKNCNNIAPIHKLDIKLEVNKKYKLVTKITCKDFYWHIIDKQKHTPTNLKSGAQYIQISMMLKCLYGLECLKLPLKYAETFSMELYKGLYHAINVKKIKDSSVCNFCNKRDDLQHFVPFCPKKHEFWKF